ncbi:hypothetical protein C2S52_008685 [Perilla frutescens var. hirtella]|nr:hypothetical protein C2S51_017614 [Perilla frutescens var. frutescens]KAH6783726.1 hypothetical protein C2S52_008685 [Perilla frutescens var. hirtella]
MKKVSYASTVGSLMYVMLCTRPDICYVIGMVNRYQSNPGQGHWTAVKNILKYLKRTRDYMLVYRSDSLMSLGYTDSNFQSDKDQNDMMWVNTRLSHRDVEIGETKTEKREKIRHLQKEAFQLANYYFVFQGVIFTAFYSTQSHLKCVYRWIPFTLSFLAGFINLCSLLAIACTYKTTLDDIDNVATSGTAGDGAPPVAVKCASNWRLLYVAACMLCVTAFFVITLVGCLTITCAAHAD